MAKNNIIENNGKDKNYFISTRNEKEDIVVYASEPFKLSEIDLINLIKVCLIEARNKTIGRKILAIYRDSTSHRLNLTKERLGLIGVNEEEKAIPTKVNKKTKFK
jgi:hypothetical protein